MIKKETERNPYFELLRILLMMFITLHHFTNDCGLRLDNVYINTWSQFFTIGGKLGVNGFVLISSYFLCEKKYSSLRLVKLHAQVLFYNMAALVIGLMLCRDYVTPLNVMKSVFPVTFSGYWFITAFFGMLIFSGVLNTIIKRMTYEEHCICILVCILLLTILPTLTTQTPYNSDLGWFITLYFIGAYLKKYDTPVKKFLANGWIFVITWCLIFFSSVTMILLGKKITYFNEGINFFSGMYILTQLVQSVSLFLFFEKQKKSSSTAVQLSKLGKYTLACYLIQSNCILVHYRGNFNRWLWTQLPPLTFPVVTLLSVIIYCFLAIMIDFGRVKLDSALNMKKIYAKAAGVIDHLLDKITQLI